ncbi:MAG: hypothetical protein ACOCR1_04305 [Planctomycetota bacterium]
MDNHRTTENDAGPTGAIKAADFTGSVESGGGDITTDSDLPGLRGQ